MQDHREPPQTARRDAEGRAIALMGMSGVGKTRLAAMLRRTGRWFHYSVDYRIGTRYLADDIADALKREAMRSPMLRDLLMTDSVFIGSNLSVDDLSPLSRWVGLPGDPARGGLPFEEYLDRQRRHRTAEIQAMADAPHFIARARDLYGYEHFLCDTSGSLVEIVDPNDPADPVMTALKDRMSFVLIDGADGDEDELCRRYDADPKPIYFDETFLVDCWRDHLDATGAASESDVDPQAFMRGAFRKLIRRRAPRYRAIAERWGVVVPKARLAEADAESAFLAEIDAAEKAGA